MMTTLPDPNDIITVRTATTSDRPLVRRIECACFGRSRLLFGLWHKVGGRDTHAYLLLVNGVAAGYLIAYQHELDGHPVMYVGGVGVLPLYRQHGLGTRLMKTVMADFPSLWLHVRAGNRPAFVMYRHLEMFELRRLHGFYSNGDDALVMVTPDLLRAREVQASLNSIYNAI